MKLKLVVLLAMLMLMLAVAAPAFASPETRECIERTKLVDPNVPTGVVAQNCAKGRR